MMFAKKIEKVLSHMQGNRFVKVATISGFTAIILANIVTLLNPTQGYELSIYDATPSIVWYCLIFSSSCGISIIVFEVYTKHCNNLNSWIYGLVLLLISRITLLWLPYNRGYVAWGGDHMTHIGIVEDVLISGFVAPDNYYPIVHIFLSEMALTANLSAEFLTEYSTVLMSVFFVVSIYLIGTYLLKDKTVSVLALAAAGCVIFSRYDVYLMPNGWSVLFFPFALLLVVKATEKESKLAYKIIAAIILILFPFFHTLSALLLAIVIILLAASHTILSKFGYLRSQIEKYFLLPDCAPSPAILGVLLVTWTTWTLSFRTFHPNIRSLFNSIFSDTDTDVLASMGNKVSKMNFDLFDLVFLAVKEEGPTIVFLILFIFGSYLIFNAYCNEQEFRRIIIFIGVTFFFGFLYASYLFGILPGLGSVAGGRILAYVKVMIPIFAGIVYMHILSKRKAIGILLCIGVIMIPVVLSIFGVFPSPYVHRPTPQITVMDIHGMGWSFDKTDRDIHYVEIMSPPYRFADAILGKGERAQRSDIQRYAENVPDHFNYLENSYFGESYLSDRYLVLTEFDRILYSTVYKSVGRFDEPDFIRLKNDPSVQYLYSNGECEVYYIYQFFTK
jgi:hypothetical protein